MKDNPVDFLAYCAIIVEDNRIEMLSLFVFRQKIFHRVKNFTKRGKQPSGICCIAERDRKQRPCRTGNSRIPLPGYKHFCLPLSE